MPLYEYLCKDCSTRFELLIPADKGSNGASCETCSSPNVQRLISSFATAGGFDDSATLSASKATGGGCCGGSCGCGN